MIPLRATPRSKHDTASRRPQLPNALNLCSFPLVDADFAAGVSSALAAEPALLLPAPHHERRHDVLVGAGPAVLEVDLGQGMVARLVGVEGLVLVQQVIFGEQTRVDVAVLQADGGGALVMDVRSRFASALAQHVLEYEELAGG